MTRPTAQDVESILVPRATCVARTGRGRGGCGPGGGGAGAGAASQPIRFTVRVSGEIRAGPAVNMMPRLSPSLSAGGGTSSVPIRANPVPVPCLSVPVACLSMPVSVWRCQFRAYLCQSRTSYSVQSPCLWCQSLCQSSVQVTVVKGPAGNRSSCVTYQLFSVSTPHPKTLTIRQKSAQV